MLKGFRQRRVADAWLSDSPASCAAHTSSTPQIDDHSRGLLHAALNSLAEDDREILMLTAWEGLTP